MFRVVDSRYEKNTILESKDRRHCWDYLVSRLLHPSKYQRTEAQHLIVKSYEKICRTPHYIGYLYGL